MKPTYSLCEIAAMPAETHFRKVGESRLCQFIVLSSGEKVLCYKWLHGWNTWDEITADELTARYELVEEGE